MGWMLSVQHLAVKAGSRQARVDANKSWAGGLAKETRHTLSAASKAYAESGRQSGRQSGGAGVSNLWPDQGQACRPLKGGPVKTPVAKRTARSDGRIALVGSFVH